MKTYTHINRTMKSVDYDRTKVCFFDHAKTQAQIELKISVRNYRSPTHGISKGIASR